MELIKCEELSFSYGSLEVLQNISFQVDEGDYLCIIGRNGSGKSTLVKLMLGLLTPSSGSVSLGGGLCPGETGYLPQTQGNRIMFPASVYEVVLSGCLSRGSILPCYTKSQREKALGYMEELGFADLRSSMFFELSGGQQRKVLLARALCATRKLLLMDEPCAGLDPVAQADFYKTIDMLNKKGVAIIMVTHDMDAVRRNARNVLHVQKQTLYFGAAADYPFDSPDAGLFGRE